MKESINREMTMGFKKKKHVKTTFGILLVVISILYMTSCGETVKSGTYNGVYYILNEVGTTDYYETKIHDWDLTIDGKSLTLTRVGKEYNGQYRNSGEVIWDETNPMGNPYEAIFSIGEYAGTKISRENDNVLIIYEAVNGNREYTITIYFEPR